MRKLANVFMLNRLLPAQLVLSRQLTMIAVAIAVSTHILRLPTFKKTFKKKRDFYIKCFSI
jgi:hypothetical protein